jgi:hypothetical protein
MKTYEHKNGIYIIGASSIPTAPDNTDYARMLTEVAAGTAEIVEYVPPPPTWDGVRAERNAKLVASDWMATQDRTMTQAEKAYRQALRDIPQTFGAPAEVVWP